jgi:hypothetical protein
MTRRNKTVERQPAQWELDLKESGLKAVYYRPTYRSYVCLLLDGQKIVSRGISVCSNKDNFSKYMGRQIATSRALDAFYTGDTKNPMPERMAKLLFGQPRGGRDMVFDAQVYFSRSFPVVSLFELSIIADK